MLKKHQVTDIREKYFSKKIPVRDISKEYGITPNHVYAILHNKVHKNSGGHTEYVLVSNVQNRNSRLTIGKIIRINKNNVIKKYDNIELASQDIYTRHNLHEASCSAYVKQNIARCILGYSQTAYGFKWIRG